MEYNELLDWYKDEIKIDKSKHEFKVYVKNSESEEIAKINIDNVCNFLNTNFENICNIIADALLKEKNEKWLDDDEDVLSREYFIKILNKIDSISINDDLTTTIYFDDNNLFWGTLIEVNLDKDLHIINVGLVK